MHPIRALARIDIQESMRAKLAVSDDPDQALVMARGGDPVAFAAIVRRHQAMVFSLALHVLRSRTAAEDVAQDVFLEFYRSLARIESDAHAVAWLRRVTSHRCIDELRRARYRVEMPTSALPDVGSPASARDRVVTADDVSAIRKQLAGPGWTRMVTVDSKKERKLIEIYNWREGNEPGGVAILVAEPKELTVVNIVGRMDLANLGALQGQFGIPRLPDAPRPPAPPTPPSSSPGGN